MWHRYKIGGTILIARLTLTFTADFMAISFWADYGDYDPAWWLPNIALMFIPLTVFTQHYCQQTQTAASP